MNDSVIEGRRADGYGPANPSWRCLTHRGGAFTRMEIRPACVRVSVSESLRKESEAAAGSLTAAPELNFDR